MRDDDSMLDPPHGRPDEAELRFRTIVDALHADDPRFTRRCSAPAAGTPSAGSVAVGVGIVVTLLLGLLPLAIGVWLSSPVLVGVGAVHTLVLPVMVPLGVVTLLERRRPLWA